MALTLTPSQREGRSDCGHRPPSRCKGNYAIADSAYAGDVRNMGPAHTRKNFDEFFKKRGLDKKERFN